jgi:hypothetical protein
MRPRDKVVLNYPIFEFRLIKAVEKRDGLEGPIARSPSSLCNRFQRKSYMKPMNSSPAILKNP